MKKSGRPPLPEENVRGYALQIRISPIERDLFVRAARLDGLLLSAWARITLLKMSKEPSAKAKRT